MQLWDSFLVRDGRAIRPGLHAKRCGNHSVFQTLAASCPAGLWFPKIVVDTSSQVADVAWRPAPQLRFSTTIWVPVDQDARKFPHLKGPDMAWQAKMRQGAVEAGADDALLHSGGYAREAANAAIVWFTADGPVQAPVGDVLESVTVRATVQAGLIPQIQRRPISLEEALATPAWAASSLHGWTPVTRWIVAGQGVNNVSVHPGKTRTPGVSLTAVEVNAALWVTAEPLTVLSR